MTVLKTLAGALVGALLLADAGAALAAEPTPVQAARQKHFKDIGHAFKAAREALKGPAPSIAVIQASAKTIDDLAPQLLTWFPAGSGEGGKTEALPVIWQKPGEFKAASEKLATAAHAFDVAAMSGNAEAVKAAVPALGEACKNCHDTFRAKDEH